jgi:hypothetical protein
MEAASFCHRPGQFAKRTGAKGKRKPAKDTADSRKKLPKKIGGNEMIPKLNV